MMFFMFIVVAGGISYFMFNYVKAKGKQVIKNSIGTTATAVIENITGKTGIQFDYDKDKETFSIKDKKGEDLFTFGQDSKFPETFPKDVPVFPSAKFDTHMALMGLKTYVWHTDRSAQEVIQFYDSNMKSLGWQTVENRNREDEAFVSMKKGERQVMIQANREDGVTNFSIIEGAENLPNMGDLEHKD